MEYKVFIFSNKIFSSQIQFDVNLFNKICTHWLCSVKEFIIQKIDEKANEFYDDKSNIIVFCDNDNLDNLIIKNMPKLGENKEFVNEQIVIFDKNGQKIIFVPTEVDLSLLNKTFEKCENNLVLHHYKLFGICEKELFTKLEELKKQLKKFDFKFISNDLVCDLTVTFGEEDDLANTDKLKFIGTFKPYIFSENDLNLEDIAISLLRTKNKTISLCGGETNGYLLCSLLKNKEDENLIKRVDFNSFSFESNEILVDKTLNFLKLSGSDIAICACKENIENGFNMYFCLADKDEIHIYKNKFNGFVKDYCKAIKNVILFQLIKKLRKNDFAF